MRATGSRAPLTLTTPNPKMHYHPMALAAAYEIKILTGHMVLNPYDTESTSLLTADKDWIDDFLSFNLFVKFLRDYSKRDQVIR